MAYFGVDSHVRIEELTLKFRHQIRAKGKSSPSEIKKVF